MEVLAKYLRMENRETLKQTYSLYKKVLEPVPYVTLKGIQNILNDMATTDPKAASFNTSSLIENRFVKELDGSGYIKGALLPIEWVNIQ